MIIRPVRPEDAKDIQALRVMKGVRETILALASERVTSAAAYIDGLTANDHVMVAEADGRVVGCAGLHIPMMPRQRHTAALGIMVHAEHQGKGIGKALMKALLDLADRFGSRADDATVHVPHELTQEELAQLVGASRETVNKSLAEFVSRGWIRLEGRGVHLLDVDRLRRRAR